MKMNGSPLSASDDWKPARPLAEPALQVEIAPEHAVSRNHPPDAGDKPPEHFAALVDQLTGVITS